MLLQVMQTVTEQNLCDVFIWYLRILCAVAECLQLVQDGHRIVLTKRSK